MEDSMKKAAKLVRKAIKIGVGFIYHIEISSVATDEECGAAKGYFVENPKIFHRRIVFVR
jgi:hypothetical protein